MPHYLSLELFFLFLRCSELCLFYVYLFNSLTNLSVVDSNKSLFLVITFIFSCDINYILKNYVFRPLFGYFGDYIPILGHGSRPPGAKDCGYFTYCPNKDAKSFGFPSGHSQFAGVYNGFMITDIIKNNSSNGSFSGLKVQAKFSVIMHILYSLLMMFSRVYIQGCHTIEQTIFGTLIGLFIGYISNFLYRKFKIYIERLLPTGNRGLLNKICLLIGSLVISLAL